MTRKVKEVKAKVLSVKGECSLGHKAGDFPVAEKAARECLSLPIYPELTEEQIQRAAAVIKEFLAKR